MPLFCWAVLAGCFGAAFSDFACVALAFTGAEFVGAFADALEFCAGFCVCAALAGAVAVVLAACVVALGCSAFVFTGALAVAVVLPSALAGTAFFPATGCAALPSFPALAGAALALAGSETGVFFAGTAPFLVFGVWAACFPGASFFGGMVFVAALLSLVEGVVCFRAATAGRRFFCSARVPVLRAGLTPLAAGIGLCPVFGYRCGRLFSRSGALLIRSKGGPCG